MERLPPVRKPGKKGKAKKEWTDQSSSARKPWGRMWDGEWKIVQTRDECKVKKKVRPGSSGTPRGGELGPGPKKEGLVEESRRNQGKGKKHGGSHREQNKT